MSATVSDTFRPEGGGGGGGGGGGKAAHWQPSILEAIFSLYHSPTEAGHSVVYRVSYLSAFACAGWS